MSALFPTTPEGASAGAELVTTDGRTLPLVASALRAEAHGGIARFVLEQRFENKFAETLRVTYRMPLPADGAVSGYAFDIGERTITGVVDRKAAARERFEQAIAHGKTAALLEQERGDIFTQQIGNIPPGEAVVARITVDQRLAWLPEGEWELRFPTVIGPRYIGTADTALDVKATHVKVTDRPLPVKVSVELAIKDAITGGRQASSPTHALTRRADGVIELASAARLDRDIVVRWPVATPEAGLSVETARPTAGAEAFGLLTIVPPAKAAKQRAVARDLIVLLDTSGSMGGGPLDKAKQVVAMLIDSLDEQDRFELIEFSSNPSRYRPEPISAIAKAKQDAIKWVRSRRAEGGTEMRAAVSEALCTLRIGAQRQVVVVTDGYVGGEQQILEVLHHKLPRSCRLHVLGVGAAVNRSLATALARAGRGAEVILGVDEDAERGAKRLLDRTRMPMLTNVEISGSALLGHAPEHIPDVFEGAPLVAALLLKADGGELIVRGELAHDRWEQRIMMPPRRAGDGNQAIVTLYGRERVADLESRTMLEQVNADVEALGLQFQISTRFTSWVAIDEVRRTTGPVRDVLVPQEVPYGTRAAAFGLRRGGALQLSGSHDEAMEFADEGPTGPSYASELGSVAASARYDSYDSDESVVPSASSASSAWPADTVLRSVSKPTPVGGVPRGPASGPPMPRGAGSRGAPPAPGRSRRTTDVDAPAPASYQAENRPPRPTEAAPLPLAPRAPEVEELDVGSGPSEIFGDSEKTDERKLAYAPKQEAPRRITQQSMSVPPPPPASPSVSPAKRKAEPAPIASKGMAPAKPKPEPEPALLASKAMAPATRFVPFWLTVLILAALLALITWWLAS